MYMYIYIYTHMLLASKTRAFSFATVPSLNPVAPNSTHPHLQNTDRDILNHPSQNRNGNTNTKATVRVL